MVGPDRLRSLGLHRARPLSCVVSFVLEKATTSTIHLFTARSERP